MFQDPITLHLQQQGAQPTIVASNDPEVKGTIQLARTGILPNKSTFAMLPRPEGDTTMMAGQDPMAECRTMLTLSHALSGKGISSRARHLARMDALVPVPGMSDMTTAKPIAVYVVLDVPEGLGYQAVQNATLPLLQALIDFLNGLNTADGLIKLLRHQI